MPRRHDLQSILILGSGPIVIGQACEFDYSGVQACKALRADGYRIVLINSNPATIMTDPEIADRTYVEPLTVEVLDQILERERPDAILPTVGGQTALNLAVQAAEAGILAKHTVELIGASIDAIKVAEDRLLFRDAMTEIGIATPNSRYVRSMKEAFDAIEPIGFPIIVRPLLASALSLLLVLEFCSLRSALCILSFVFLDFFLAPNPRDSSPVCVTATSSTMPRLAPPARRLTAPA